MWVGTETGHPGFRSNLLWELHRRQEQEDQEWGGTSEVGLDGEKRPNREESAETEEVELVDVEEEEPSSKEVDPVPEPGLNPRAQEILEMLNQLNAEGAGGGGEEDKEEEVKGVHSIPKIRPKESKFKFCPRCSNLLQVHNSGSRRSKTADSFWRWKCVTCPYILPVLRQHRYLIFSQKHEEDDEDQIVETEKANEHRQRTEILCPVCDHREAYFYQMQTRSADEPMTTFYQCVSRTCGHHWRD